MDWVVCFFDTEPHELLVYFGVSSLFKSHDSVEGPLGCSQFSAIIDSAATDIFVWVSLYTHMRVSKGGCTSRSGVTGLRALCSSISCVVYMPAVWPLPYALTHTWWSQISHVQAYLPILC